MKIIILIAALILTACGQSVNETPAVAVSDPVAVVPASAVVAAPVAPVAVPTALTKEDVQALVVAAAEAEADKVVADKAVADKAATEKRIQRAERAATQAKAEAVKAATEKIAAEVAATAAAKAAAEPVYADIPRRVCEMKQVTVQVEVADAVKPVERSSLGMLLGGAAGALLGTQVGGGQGRTIATIGGAAAGAYAGDSVANSSDKAKPGTHLESRTSTVEVCHDVVEHIRVR